MTAILVYQDNPVGVEFFTYASDMQALSFVSINLHRSWPKRSIDVIHKFFYNGNVTSHFPLYCIINQPNKGSSFQEE